MRREESDGDVIGLMAKTSVNYQCPNCSAPLPYQPGKEKAVCEYCGTEFEISVLEELYRHAEERAAQERAAQEAKWDTDAAGSEWTEEEAAALRAFTCSSCGAEIVSDENTMATECCYCGNPTLLPSRFAGMLKPDYIIPFKKTKQEAVAALKEFYKGKYLLPSSFTGGNRVEAIQPMYVPFWLFDGKAIADVSYRATRVHSMQHGNEMITTTEYYDVRRAGTVRFTRIPADGSAKMPDDLMDSIEPFDYRELKPFTTAYMPGYLADIYDVDDKKSFERAQKRGSNTAAQIMDSSVNGYSSVTPVHQQIHVQRENTAYALLPVWMLSTQWNGKNFIFAMNGQTGKFIGDLPISTGRYFAWFAGIAAPLAALLAVLLKLM